MVPDDFIFPIKEDINNVVVTYPKGGGSKGPKYIRVRQSGKRRNSLIEFTEDVIYTTEDINEIHHNHLLGEVVQVDESTIPRIKKYTQWKSLSEYLEGFGDADVLAKKGVVILNEDSINKWKFLEGTASKEIGKILSENVKIKDVKLLNVCKYLCLNKELEHKGLLDNLLRERYPMLQFVSDYSLSYDSNVREKTINYVRLIENTQKEKE